MEYQFKLNSKFLAIRKRKIIIENMDLKITNYVCLYFKLNLAKYKIVVRSYALIGRPLIDTFSIIGRIFAVKTKILGYNQNIYIIIYIIEIIATTVDRKCCQICCYKIKSFEQKSKCWSKIEILINNRNFSRKSNLWSIIKMFVIKLKAVSKIKKN